MAKFSLLRTKCIEKAKLPHSNNEKPGIYHLQNHINSLALKVHVDQLVLH